MTTTNFLSKISFVAKVFAKAFYFDEEFFDQIEIESKIYDKMNCFDKDFCVLKVFDRAFYFLNLIRLDKKRVSCITFLYFLTKFIALSSSRRFLYSFHFRLYYFQRSKYSSLRTLCRLSINRSILKNLIRFELLSTNIELK